MEKQNQPGFNRRDFLKTTGIGMAAVSFAGAGLIHNSNVVSAADILQETVDTDVLVIGGGLAGSF